MWEESGGRQRCDRFVAAVVGEHCGGGPISVPQDSAEVGGMGSQWVAFLRGPLLIIDGVEYLLDVVESEDFVLLINPLCI